MFALIVTVIMRYHTLPRHLVSRGGKNKSD